MAGSATLWLAVGADLGSMLIVTLNGMKLLQKKDSAGNHLSNESAAL